MAADGRDTSSMSRASSTVTPCSMAARCSRRVMVSVAPAASITTQHAAPLAMARSATHQPAAASGGSTKSDTPGRSTPLAWPSRASAGRSGHARRPTHVTVSAVAVPPPLRPTHPTIARRAATIRPANRASNPSGGPASPKNSCTPSSTRPFDTVDKRGISAGAAAAGPATSPRSTSSNCSAAISKGESPGTPRPPTPSFPPCAATAASTPRHPVSRHLGIPMPQMLGICSGDVKPPMGPPTVPLAAIGGLESRAEALDVRGCRSSD